MSNTHQTISDKDFQNQFEKLTLDHQYFDHLGHLRIAWLYLMQSDLEQAVDSTCNGIRSYAESLGAKDKFNFTISYALVMIISNRMNAEKQSNWQNFLNKNRDLADDALGILCKHYNKSTLFSEDARKQLILPDIKDFQ
ncbi:hypothetical protein OE749_04885 [Aestuariibacter sp. AA17]|uniref:Uncharacterized protein n=1 Tax=Fluctibacter corallii TaxID=2984329 RepID=A0ABT3A5Y9_9ALTE|nr:hypothetical protein [Aestuariibacter sp. AA17]MCV2884023.1 hypothetical protein [Aestuariibacter sp. AA17]